MKSSNLAWRIEPFEESLEARPVESAGPPAWSALETPDANARAHLRLRPGFEQRTIEIRDQGFAPFRIR